MSKHASDTLLCGGRSSRFNGRTLRELKVIAYAHNGHTDKFGIPRQSREESPIVTRIVFEPEYSVKEALRGIEGFSHLWILWGFSEITRSRDHETTTEEQAESAIDGSCDWSPTVRPPRLGGNKRVGVFATRSPFRPNPIGLSSVRLLGVRWNDGMSAPKVLNDAAKLPNDGKRMELLVGGADLMDGTPIYDIKPYLSFTDSHEDAVCGFAEETKNRTLPVEFCSCITLGLPSYCSRDALVEEISYILGQDPRPAYQDDPDREYKMDYSGYRVTFIVKNGTVFVKKIQKL